MTCIVVYVVLRATVVDPILRSTFCVIGCIAPAFVLYVIVRALFSKERITIDEKDQMLRMAETIESERRLRFGSVILPSHRRLHLEYVRALNKTTETIERVIEKTA